jgi:hypothetical protein
MVKTHTSPMIGNVEKPCFRLYKNPFSNSSRFPTPEMAHSPARPKTSPQNQCSSLNLEHTAQYVEDILSPSSYDRFLECLIVSFIVLLVSFRLLLVNFGRLLVSFSVLLVNFAVLLVNFRVLLVNSAVPPLFYKITITNPSGQNGFNLVL